MPTRPRPTRKDVIKALTQDEPSQVSSVLDEMVNDGLLRAEPDVYGEIRYWITEKGWKLMEEKISETGGE